jgi:PII-like signaling protein
MDESLNLAPGPASRLRLYMGESDHWHGRPLYEALVLLARERQLAGATVLRGPMGYGASCQVHSAKILTLSTDLPVVVEIVDREEKIRSFMAEVQGMLEGGLAVLDRVDVLHHRTKPGLQGVEPNPPQ